MSDVIGDVRWSAEQVLALAPDAAAQRAARGLATGRPWRAAGYAPGADPPTLWGVCQGSGSTPYQICVDLAEPAYRCSCPSRKVPCKHTLGLLLWWAQGGVDTGQPVPPWVEEWRAGRAERAQRRATTSRGPASPQARARRAERVLAGLDELDRWLADQVRVGLASVARAGYAHWDAMAARLVDAQAPGAAAAVFRLASAATDPTGDRLLAELALLRLLVSAYRRLETLPDDLAATVRARVGLPVPTEEVLAGPRLRDRWQVLGLRDQFDERLTTRRVWLRGARTGRYALVLSFAVAGQALAADLVVGTGVDAELCFFPGAQPLRALVAERHGPADSAAQPVGQPVAEALARYAAALAADPWLDRWPMLLADVTLTGAGSTWHAVDAAGNGLRIDPAGGDPWRLVAAAGGRPLTLAGEWSPWGLRLVTGWVDGRLVPHC